MKTYMAYNLKNLNFLNENIENIRNGLIAIVTCEVGKRGGVCKYIATDSCNFEFRHETNNVLTFLIDSNSFDILKNQSSMDRICDNCADFETPSSPGCYAFKITSGNYNFAILCNKNNRTVTLYAYDKNID